ncbi:hypothetical protein UFOVP655_15 [uncultured Caudovirales phage]|uniref:Uncharacterized protein n=1 Tax=uncultured Caudovirales phage TaxID=2100421 RepID=A0A6J5N9Y3_9CAUD|nr:hypothetical protein UFOVP655_15 [uncultured Caudovirales phage]
MKDDYSSLNAKGVMSVLGSFAVQTHEIFMELQNAGFTEEQAIKIVVGLASKE